MINEYLKHFVVGIALGAASFTSLAALAHGTAMITEDLALSMTQEERALFQLSMGGWVTTYSGDHVNLDRVFRIHDSKDGCVAYSGGARRYSDLDVLLSKDSCKEFFNR